MSNNYCSYRTKQFQSPQIPRTRKTIKSSQDNHDEYLSIFKIIVKLSLNKAIEMIIAHNQKNTNRQQVENCYFQLQRYRKKHCHFSVCTWDVRGMRLGWTAVQRGTTVIAPNDLRTGSAEKNRTYCRAETRGDHQRMYGHSGEWFTGT